MKVSADNNEVGADNMPEQPAPVVNYDVEDKADGDKTADQARSIKLEFDSVDIKF